MPQTPYDRFPYGLASPVDAYARGLRRMLAPSPLTSEFMGMAGCAPAAFHELPDDEGESNGSSIGNVAPHHRPSQECAMADAPGQPPVVVESTQTHTPLDPRAGAHVLAQEHCEELRQRRQNQPPPASARLAHHDVPHARNPVSGSWGRACQV